MLEGPLPERFHPGRFKKGKGDQRDPRIVPYQEGDGRKRHPFPKGEIANPKIAAGEYNFKPGHNIVRKSPKVHARSIKLIPAKYHIQVSPDADALELVSILDDTIAFARQMQDMISRSTNPNNNKATGRYTELILKCLDTSARIKGQQVEAAKYGKLKAEAVKHLKSEYAQVLMNNMAKLRHSIDYAREEQETDEEGNVVCYPAVFDQNGEVKRWAGEGFCFLISGARRTIELRAALDAWERRVVWTSDSIVEAHRRKMQR